MSVGSTVRIISTSTLVAIDDKYRGDLDPVKCFCECMSAWLREEDKVKDKDGPSWLPLVSALDTIGYYTVLLIHIHSLLFVLLNNSIAR